MNQVRHFSELMGFNSEAGLAMTIKDSLEQGIIVNHVRMMVVIGKGIEMSDPVTKRKVTLPEGIHARMKSSNLLAQEIGPWSMIAPVTDLEHVAEYLAHETPVQDRYLMMVDLLNNQVEPQPRVRPDVEIAP